MDLHLRGKRVLITGASKGIGAAAAEAFAEEGCHLRLAARSGDQLKALAERLRAAHQIDATAHVVDLRKPEDLDGVRCFGSFRVYVGRDLYGRWRARRGVV